MTQDLTDPGFEPTDEQLRNLSQRAFEGARRAHEQALVRLRAEIAAERARVLARLDSVEPPKPTST
jgi:hypothetical protein